MENINALYKALEQADAAGDKDTAQQLADQIRLIPSQSVLVNQPNKDINALYKALEQADAAGDKDTAQQIADQIRTLPPEETTEQPVVDVTQPQPDLTQQPVMGKLEKTAKLLCKK